MIIQPTAEEYKRLGIPNPEKEKLQLPTFKEIKRISGVDLSFGLPLVKKGFFGDVSSQLYVASDHDCKRLGIRNDFRSYFVEQNIAYMKDPHGSFILSMGLIQGAAHLRLTTSELPFKEIIFRDPTVEQKQEKFGSHAMEVLFPGYVRINPRISHLNPSLGLL